MSPDNTWYTQHYCEQSPRLSHNEMGEFSRMLHCHSLESKNPNMSMSTGFKPLYESPLRNQCTAPPKYSRYLRASLRAAFPDYRSKACGRVEKRPI